MLSKKAFYFSLLGGTLLVKTTIKHLLSKEEDIITDHHNTDITFDKLVSDISSSDKELNSVFSGNTNLNKRYRYVSTPFNRVIKEIYGIEFVEYKNYENYDFNHLSDFFLNIHIFVN